MAFNFKLSDEEIVREKVLKDPLDVNLIYEKVDQYFKEKEMGTDSDIYKPVFDALKKLASEYIMSGSEDVDSACQFSYSLNSFISPSKEAPDNDRVKACVLELWHILKPLLG